MVENLKSNNTYLVINSVTVLLQNLSCFDVTIDEKMDDQRTYIAKIIQQCLPEIFKWMDFYFRNWHTYTNMENCCLVILLCLKIHTFNMTIAVVHNYIVICV